MPFARNHPVLIGWMLGLATVAVVGLVIAGLMVSGIAFDTSAEAQHSRPVAWIVHLTMTDSVSRRSSDAALPRLSFDQATIAAGAREYEASCVSCHGGPGVARAPWVSGMLPTPPYLLDASQHWSPRELYTILHDGVKMTGMPAWTQVKSPEQLAQLVAFLEAMPRLKPDVYARLTGHQAAVAQRSPR